MGARDVKKAKEKLIFLASKGVRQAMKLRILCRGSRKSDFNIWLGKQLRGRTFRD